MARGGGFPGMGMGGNMQQLARQAQKLQATSGGGMVMAKVNGKKELLELTIKPEAVDPDDVEMLQDLVMAAVNEALRTATETSEQEMGKLTGGMNLGGLF